MSSLDNNIFSELVLWETVLSIWQFYALQRAVQPYKEEM